MHKLQIAWLSIGLAFLLIFAARNFSDDNPFSIVQLPGWAIAFGILFTAEDNLTTVVLFESIYWIVNLCLWFPIFFAVLFTIHRAKRDTANEKQPANE